MFVKYCFEIFFTHLRCYTWLIIYEVITDDSDVSETGEFPCISCHTNCCKEYVIFVNAHDIYRLSVGLGLAPESFLEIYGAKDYDLE